ncbi:hypothetical protein COB55_05195 [Candidatus Wolfebacteria bacterium]|nr:MAG: hypothetical protein COB55_05195 [Candidatus Wolfebacteria bacterium]
MSLDILIATAGVFVGELYGNLIGGGSLVTQIALQNILHFDIKTAMALDNSAVIGSNIGMLIVLLRHHVVEWWFAVVIVFQIIGAILGAWILITIDPNILKVLFILAMIGLVTKNIFVKDSVQDSSGFKVSYRNISLLALAALFIGMYNAAFVIGDWIIALLILTSFFSIKYHNAIFLLTFSMFFSQPVALYKYHAAGLIDWSFLLPMMTATIVGGVISALVLNRIHSKKLESFLKYLSIVLVVYLIFGLLG